MQVVESVYRVSGVFLKSEAYGLTSELRCAAVSVLSNLADGQARASTKVETQLETAVRLNYIGETRFYPIREQCDHPSRQLYRYAMPVKAISADSLIPHPESQVLSRSKH